jgi:hypothetical protein
VPQERARISVITTVNHRRRSAAGDVDRDRYAEKPETLTSNSSQAMVTGSLAQRAERLPGTPFGSPVDSS